MKKLVIFAVAALLMLVTGSAALAYGGWCGDYYGGPRGGRYYYDNPRGGYERYDDRYYGRGWDRRGYGDGDYRGRGRRGGGGCCW